jgi:hypothetical protein
VIRHLTSILQVLPGGAARTRRSDLIDTLGTGADPETGPRAPGPTNPICSEARPSGAARGAAPQTCGGAAVRFPGTRAGLRLGGMLDARSLAPLGALLALGLPACSGKSYGPVSGQRAYEHTARIVALGPRPPGSENLRKAAAYIEEQLRAIDPALKLERQRFEKFGMEFENLFVELPGKDPNGPVIAVGAHYDSKITHPGEQDFAFVGALDAAASCGVLIELARQFRAARPIDQGLWLIWFDGEESLEWDWNDEKALIGSRHFADTMHADEKRFPGGLSRRMKAFVLLDLLGDHELKIDRDLESNPTLLGIFEKTATKMGVRDRLYRYESPMKDDHLPFKEKSVRVVDLIDFAFRPPAHHTAQTPEDGRRYTAWWHTAEDTMDQVSAESLDLVGNLVWHALPAIAAEIYR